MEILKEGKNPSDKKYEGECHTCETLVSFKRSEAKYTPDQRDGDFLTVECPVCGDKIHTSI